MDLYFQGRACLNKGLTPKNLTQARGFFERALALDPEISMRWSVWRGSISKLARQLFDRRPGRASAAAEARCQGALPRAEPCLGPFDLGWCLIYTNRAAQGMAECERALALDRNLADAHAMMVQAKIYMGRGCRDRSSCPRSTPPLSSRYLRLSMDESVGLAKLQLGADAEAVAWVREASRPTEIIRSRHFGTRRSLGASRRAG